jgi:hypothetical protein
MLMGGIKKPGESGSKKENKKKKFFFLAGFQLGQD